METKKKVPAIRFSGFDEEWVKKRLGDIGTTYTGLSGKTKDDFGRGDGQFVTYMNVFSNPLTNSLQLEKVGVDDTQNEVKKGDVFFTTSSETPGEVGMSSVWLHDIKNVYLNSFCFAFRPIVDVESYYLAYLLRSSSIRKHFSFLAQGISRYNISKGKAMDISIPLPNKNEQTKIGNYFIELDELIRLQEQKHEKLVNLKKAMLDKMFPKEGADVPEIRFKGFTDKWEEKKLGEIFNIKNGYAFKSMFFKKEVSTYIVVTPGNVAIGGGFQYDKGHYYRGEFSEDYVLKNGDIFLTLTDLTPTAKTLGFPAIVPDDCNTYLHNQRLGKLVNIKSNRLFIYHLLSTTSYQHEVVKSSSGTTVKHSSGQLIENIKVSIPSLQEQQQIGAYFENLDKLIVQSQEQINKYKNIKQALLQKMFV